MEDEELLRACAVGELEEAAARVVEAASADGAPFTVLFVRDRTDEKQNGSVVWEEADTLERRLISPLSCPKSFVEWRPSGLRRSRPIVAESEVALCL